MKTAHQRLVMVGDRDGLKELLRRRLVECGWRDQVKLISKEIIKEHGHDISYDTLLSTVTSRARTLVPDSVKKELLQKIKNQLLAQEEKLKIMTDHIEPTDKVERIKERVEEKEGIPPQQQRLIFSGKQMNDEKTAQDYKVQGGSVLHLTAEFGESSCLDVICRRSACCVVNETPHLSQYVIVWTFLMFIVAVFDDSIQMHFLVYPGFWSLCPALPLDTACK
ncbi:hypothetical protein ALC60_12968 [Trachymyrmex zeteki]|uniref:Enhancer of yellow 2 transcription factor n=1 Tax=Mycetomoellerius zeteki TaxID=64791 RepID=A0A151WJH2_9HYME|nr:hypothetical protein ALC60_12968 [Trachymyrmex zeteki]